MNYSSRLSKSFLRKSFLNHSISLVWIKCQPGTLLSVRDPGPALTISLYDKFGVVDYRKHKMLY